MNDTPQNKKLIGMHRLLYKKYDTKDANQTGEITNDYIECDTGLSGGDFDGCLWDFATNNHIDINGIKAIHKFYSSPRLWKSNNWLKMHGYPMRRRGRLK